MASKTPKPEKFIFPKNGKEAFSNSYCHIHTLAPRLLYSISGSKDKPSNITHS